MAAEKKSANGTAKKTATTSPKAKAVAKEKAQKPAKVSKKFYEKELERLQSELVKLQYWVKHEGLRVVLLFEGRDAAGKGGLITRLTAPMNPRGVRVVALPKPSDVERTQWYFQRYVAHLPAAGEIVIFDRSWYNRAGVERVMGFCTDEEYWEFLQNCPQFERLLVEAGIILIKIWLSVSDEEQEQRFQDRAADPNKGWKLSEIDLMARQKSAEYSVAKDLMIQHTSTSEAPWYELEADDKRRTRLNGIRHLLELIPYQDIMPGKIKLPPRPKIEQIARPPQENRNLIPDYYEGK
jgi:polyphosphate kinase